MIEPASRPCCASDMPTVRRPRDQTGQNSHLLLGEQLGVIVFGKEVLDVTVDPFAVDLAGGL
jgi:hypothetical protein